MKKGKRKRTRVGKMVRRRPAPGRIDHDDRQQEDEPLREKILRGRSNLGAVPDEPSRSEEESDVQAGQVVSIRGREATVAPDGGGGGVVCRLRKSTRLPHPGATALAVGDRVRYLRDGPEPFPLTEVEPRRTKLTRVRRGRHEHVICANVDLCVIVASARQPVFKARLVDRYLISAREGDLAPVLALNKIDLLESGEAGKLLDPYRGLGFPAVAVSAATGEGVDDLVATLKDRTSVFAGQSGVGKSSLLNRLIPDLALRTKEVYGRAGKGRHATTVSTLYRFPFGGSVVDTPGIRSFLLHAPSLEALHRFFPEIARAAAACRFSDCRHHGDEGCAVPDAVAEGAIRGDRLESYRVLREEIEGG